MEADSAMHEDQHEDHSGLAGQEIDAFLAALDDVPPNAVTACRGWTTHEIMAHLASGADAFANQVEAHLDGREVPEFGGWQVREVPYRAWDPRTLRRRVETSERRMTEAFSALLADDPAARVADVGWGLPIAELVKHMRQEYAVHRWDLIGDDEQGLALLGQSDLLAHSVGLLGDSLLAVGMARDPSPDEPLAVRLRCADEPDLVLTVGGGVGRLDLEQPADAPEVIETDPAARLLLLWGRRPADSRRVRSNLTADRLARLQTLLAGY
jgi:uncharacterized protein (TIGR03083 family)